MFQMLKTILEKKFNTMEKKNNHTNEIEIKGTRLIYLILFVFGIAVFTGFVIGCIITGILMK